MKGNTTPMVYKTVRALLPPVLERRHRIGNISGRNAVNVDDHISKIPQKGKHMF
jgi:hypothetical protein